MAIYDVTFFGAAGDGAADDTAAIQAAIDTAHAAGGGTVYIPAGAYLLSSALTVYSRLSLRGDGDHASELRQRGAAAGGLHGVDVSYLDVRDLQLTGPGQASGGAPGIYLTRSASTTVYGVTLTNVYVRQFGDTGVALNRPIVSSLRRVVAENNGAHGFSLYNAGTSCQFSACYANGNASAGYHLNGMVYCQLSGCASDSNGIGYELVGTRAVSFDGCGAEASVSNGPGYNGANWKIDGGDGASLSGCFVYQNTALGYWVTGSARGVALTACVEEDPAAGASASIRVDAGSHAALAGCVTATPASLAPGAASVLADPSGALRAAGAASSGAHALADAPVIAVNAALGNTFRVTLHGNRTLGNPVSAADGQRIAIEVIQDAAGRRTLAFGSAYAFGTSLPRPTLTATPGRRDILEFLYDAATGKWYLVASAKGFA